MTGISESWEWVGPHNSHNSKRVTRDECMVCTVQMTSKSTVDIIDLYFVPLFWHNQHKMCFLYSIYNNYFKHNEEAYLEDIGVS